MSIKIQTFLQNVQAIVDAKPTYKLGQDGSKGECDCIGLIIGAVRRSGATWSGTHGSNWAARNEMALLQPAPPLELGGIMYKAWKPTDSQWKLPDEYKDHPDQLDYYHVGIVTQVSPLRITHCTKSSTVDGITVDTRIGVWRYGGRLDGLDYENLEEKQPMVDVMLQVVATEGKSVNLRARPTLTSVVLAYVPVGSLVKRTVKDVQNGWVEVVYKNRFGWMLSTFLTNDIHDQEDSAEAPNTPFTLEQKVEILWRQYLKEPVA